jgi:hypothetical protein
MTIEDMVGVIKRTESAERAKYDVFLRNMEEEDEIVLEQCRDALRGLEHLCLECRADFTSISDIGFLLQAVNEKLKLVRIGMRASEIAAA